jgi:ABC-type glycerol-3-phosphate transport system substrate-binding protein
MKTSRFVLIVGLLLAALLVACGGETTPTTTDPGTSPTVAPPMAETAVTRISLMGWSSSDAENSTSANGR